MKKKLCVDFGFAENVDESQESDGNDPRTENTRADGGSVGSPAAAEAPTPPVDVSKPTNVKNKRGRPGYTMDSLVGAGFTPHVFTVNAGEDVGLKIMSLSQQGSRVVTVLSANGMISKVTLRQPSLFGGTLTHEGRFDIVQMSGSYMPPKRRGTESQSGGITISLAGPDGEMMGGGLAGMLIAAGPVQVVAGSFLPGHQRENKAEKSRNQPTSSAAAFGRVDH